MFCGSPAQLSYCPLVDGGDRELDGLMFKVNNKGHPVAAAAGLWIVNCRLNANTGGGQK